MISEILLSITLCASAFSLENEDSDVEFNFYLKEMVDHAMAQDAPMASLIANYLVEATFDTTSDRVFKTRIRQISKTLEDHPDKIDRFQYLDGKFKRTFEKKVAAAKQKRLLYAASGAVVGAIIGIPVGKLAGGGTKALFISVPSGALVGAGWILTGTSHRNARL